MKNSIRFLAFILAIFATISSFAYGAIAVNGDDVVNNESAAEESAPVNETPEPEVSDPAVSEPEVSDPVVSQPEVSEPAVSEPEVSEPVVSEPEVSEPEVSEPAVSQPETSQPVVSQPEKSEYNITFTINGAGIITVYKTKTSELITTITSGSQTLTVSEAIKFTIQGTVLDVAWNEPHRAVAGEYYYLNPSRDSSVTVTVDGESNPPESSQPEETTESFDVRVQVGSGGSVTAGDRTIGGGNGTNVTVNVGEDFIFVITPDEGYEIESFKIDGVDTEITDNQYTLNSTTPIQNITISFKTIGAETVTGISVADIDWNASQITIDVREGKAVLREVFDKIAALTADSSKYIAFVSENATIYIPYGRAVAGASPSVNMSVEVLNNGTEYDSFLKIFGNDASKFKAYVFSFDIEGNNLPMGTVISFNVGSAFANTEMFAYTFDGSKLTEKGEAVLVSADGVSGKYEYNNETILVCAAGISETFTIESILMNTGGNINPLGINEVQNGSTCNYVITTTEGFSIKQLMVDDVVIEKAVGAKNYIHMFENIGTNHTIKVEFAPDVIEQDDTVQTNKNGTVIVILVIAVVAILGAAALFIVKWRQEKY